MTIVQNPMFYLFPSKPAVRDRHYRHSNTGLTGSTTDDDEAAISLNISLGVCASINYI
jgi:hypothetical protein